MHLFESSPEMAKSSKLVAARKGRVLLVRRRRDRLWMFPGGRRRIGVFDAKLLRSCPRSRSGR